MVSFSEAVVDHFLHPRGTGSLPEPSGEGWSGAVNRSRYMRIQVAIEGGRITDARFATYGCAPAIACGSYLCDWAIGRSIQQAWLLDASALEAALGGLPPARRFCADLAVDALQAALQQWSASDHPDSS